LEESFLKSCQGFLPAAGTPQEPDLDSDEKKIMSLKKRSFSWQGFRNKQKRKKLQIARITQIHAFPQSAPIRAIRGLKTFFNPAQIK
jgi:hypothetical protein